MATALGHRVRVVIAPYIFPDGSATSLALLASQQGMACEAIPMRHSGHASDRRRPPSGQLQYKLHRRAAVRIKLFGGEVAKSAGLFLADH